MNPAVPGRSRLSFFKRAIFGIAALAAVGGGTLLLLKLGYWDTTKSGTPLPPLFVLLTSGGEPFAFDKARIKVRVGQEVRITLQNIASDGAVSHNFVLVELGREAEIVNSAALAGESKGFLPDSPHILAHTGLVRPGSSETIAWVAPKLPGEYAYISTVPGHYPGMRGVLLVNP